MRCVYQQRVVDTLQMLSAERVCVLYLRRLFVLCFPHRMRLSATTMS
jgi:hypothetical protein